MLQRRASLFTLALLLVTTVVLSLASSSRADDIQNNSLIPQDFFIHSRHIHPQLEYNHPEEYNPEYKSPGSSYHLSFSPMFHLIVEVRSVQTAPNSSEVLRDDNIQDDTDTYVKHKAIKLYAKKPKDPSWVELPTIVNEETLYGQQKQRTWVQFDVSSWAGTTPQNTYVQKAGKYTFEAVVPYTDGTKGISTPVDLTFNKEGEVTNYQEHLSQVPDEDSSTVATQIECPLSEQGSQSDTNCFSDISELFSFQNEDLFSFCNGIQTDEDICQPVSSDLT